MMEKIFKKTGKCKICRKPLSDGNLRIGFCDVCAAKETEKLRKRIRISGTLGAVLVILAVAAFIYARSTYFVSDTYGYKGDIFIPIVFGNFAVNARFFNKLINLSAPVRVLLLFWCFCIPFSSFVKVDYQTFRHDAEANLYRMEPLTGNMAAGLNNQRLDDVGLFIISLILSAVSGPYFFIYRLYKFRQLSLHMKNMTAGPSL